MKYLLLYLLLSLLPLLPATAQEDQCPPESSLSFVTGEIAQVKQGYNVRLRVSPSTAADTVTQISSSMRLVITGEAQCAEGYRWWPVLVGSQTGWVADSADGDEFLIKSIPATVSIPGENAAELPAFDTANQIDQWGYGYPVDTSWSADGEVLAVATSAGIVLYQVDDLEAEPAFLPTRTVMYTSLMFNPANASELLVTDELGGLTLWDITTGESRLFAVANASVTGAAFSRDGSAIFAHTGQYFFKWDASSGERLHTFFIDYEDTDTYPGVVTAISPDGMLVAVGENRPVLRVWDLSGAEPLATERALPQPVLRINPLAFSEDGNWLVGEGITETSALLFSWSWKTGEIELREQPYTEAVLAFDSAFMLPDTSMLTLASAYAIGALVDVWSPDSLDAPLREVNVEPYEIIRGGSLSPDRRRLAALVNQYNSPAGLVVIDLDTLQPVFESDPFPNIGSIKEAGHNTLVYNPMPNKLALRDMNTGQLLDTLDLPADMAVAVASTPDDQQLAVCAEDDSEGTVQPLLVAYDLAQSPVADIAAKAQVLFGCDWLVYDDSRQDFITNLGWNGQSQNADTLATVFGGTVVASLPADFRDDRAYFIDGSLWFVNAQGIYEMNLTSGELVQQLQNIDPGPPGVQNPSFLHEDRIVYVTGANGSVVYPYTLNTEQAVEGFDTGSPILSLAVTPDGSTIITGHVDGSIHQWEMSTFEWLGQIGRVPGSIRSLVISPDGTRLYSAGNDGVARVWSLE